MGRYIDSKNMTCREQALRKLLAAAKHAEASVSWDESSRAQYERGRDAVQKEAAEMLEARVTDPRKVVCFAGAQRGGPDTAPPTASRD